jgi:hypothetical protein
MVGVKEARQASMNRGIAIRPRFAAGTRPQGFAPPLARKDPAVKSGAFPVWFLLTAILLIPASLNVHLAGDGLKFTPGRAAITLLFLPGLVMFLRARRRIIGADVFIFLTSVWMIGSRIPEDGLNPSAVAAVIELFGGYLLGRAYVYGPFALKRFLRIFKIVTFLVISMAVLDPLFSANVVMAAADIIVANPFYTVPQYRGGIARAVSTMEMAELYGTFCVAATSIFLFLETKPPTRYLWAAFGSFGCILSLSSGPLLALIMVICFYLYDHLLGGLAWRWKLINTIFLLFLLAVFSLTAKPLSWLVSHFTLDPSTGYFRIYVFDYISDQISLKPLTGYGFGPIGDDDFLSVTTVDNVWLVCAARYGIPMIILFLLANVTTFMSFAKGGQRDVDPFMVKAATGFTQVIMVFTLVGLSVHFWNAAWQFWAVCIGIRASIKEWRARQRYGQ